MLNSGPYPDKATLQYFVAPFGVTGFRLQLLLFGIAALVLTLAPVPAQAGSCADSPGASSGSR